MRGGPARRRGRAGIRRPTASVLLALVPALLAVGVPGPATAFTLNDRAGTAPGAEVQVQADTVHYDRKSDRVEAEGHVRATRQGAVLTVDRMLWERGTGLVTADGHVVVEDGDSRLEADAIRWRLLDGTGEVENGRLVLDGRYHLEGAHLARTGPETYQVTNGLFSTCPCRANGKRDWSVTARRLDLRVPGTLVARSVRFRVRGVPVLYLPVFFFPTSARQTGLLIPTLGWDTRDGLRFAQPFYWAIDPSNDLTVAMDIRTRRGSGGALTYRYMPTRHTQGEVHLFGLRERRSDQFQGNARWRHTTRALKGWTLHADVNAVNDRDFLRTISDGTEERTADRLESNVYLERTGRDVAAVLLARQTIDLTAPSDTTVQQLPLLRVERFHVPVWGPLSAAARVDGTYLYRDSGPRAVRLTASPELAGRLPLWEGRIIATSRAGAHWIWYSPGAGGPGDHVTEAYPMSLTLAGHGRGRLWGRVHQVVPELSWRYVKVERAPVEVFDAQERLVEEHRIGARVLQRLGPVRWRVGGRYDLEAGQALPLRSELDVGPLSVGDVHIDTLHSARTGTTERVVFDWRVKWGPAVFSVGSLFDRGTAGVGTPFSPGTVLATGTGKRTHFHTFGLALGPWRGLSLTHRTYYDHEDGRRVESDYGVGFQGRCWLAEISYVNLPSRNLLRFRIGLVGPPEAPVAPEEVSKPLFGPLLAAPSDGRTDVP